MKRLLLLLTIILLTVKGYAQEEQQYFDSLLTALKTTKPDTNKVYILCELFREELIFGEYDMARKYVEEALALSEKLEFKRGIANAYLRLGALNWRLSNYPKALGYYQKAFELTNELGNKMGMAMSLGGMGNVYQNLADYPKTLECYQKALKIDEESGNKDLTANMLVNIGSIYYSISDYPKALEYYQKAMTIYEQTNNKIGLASTISNIGGVYLDLSDNIKALDYFQKSLKLHEVSGNKKGISNNLGKIGMVYDNLSDYPKALDYMQKALKIKEAMKEKNGIADWNNKIGEVYQKQGKFTEALKYDTKGLAVALEIKSMDLVKEAYGNLSVIDSAMNNFRGAYENHKLYMQTNDSMFNMEKDKKITTLQLHYEFDKVQDSTKAEQVKKDAVSGEVIKRQTLMKNAFIIGFVLVLLLALILYNRFRIKHNTNIALEEKNKIIQEEKERSDSLLLNILPSEVAEELKQKGSSNAKTYSLVTVMFMDFKDFTSISEKVSAELLVAELHYCFSAFDRIIQKHGIEKIKTIGDAYMCAGGLPALNYSHAKDMINAAFEIRDFLQQRKNEKQAKGEIPFEARTGIHTGPVVAGIVGVKKFAYDIWGDTVNLAARMESGGEAGKINISGATYILVKDEFKCIYRGKIEAKHKGEIDMYFVEPKG